jgi:hypothetical protein
MVLACLRFGIVEWRSGRVRRRIESLKGGSQALPSLPAVHFVVLPPRGAWFAAAGCWSLLFGGVVAMAYNVSHMESGVGFLMNWVS